MSASRACTRLPPRAPCVAADASWDAPLIVLDVRYAPCRHRVRRDGSSSQRWTCAMLLATVLSAGAPNARAVPIADPAVAAMLERARLWESRNRLDLAREALDKLLRLAPEYPEAMALSAEVDIRSGHHRRAQQTLERLLGIEPGHPSIARLQTLLRLSGEDKDKLRAARLLAKAGKTDAAVAAFKALYPHGPPSAELALEYWTLVAATAGGWKAAHEGLAELVRQYPDNPRYRLVLWEHEAPRMAFTPEKLRMVIALTHDPQHARQAESVWRRVIVRLHAVPASVPLLREYLAHKPGDTAVRERLDEIVEALAAPRRAIAAPPADAGPSAAETERRRLADPAYRAKIDGLALLERGDAAAAEKLLQQSLSLRPQDADAIGGIGLIRLREGRHREAERHFARALYLDPDNRSKWSSLVRTARFWGLLREADAARAARDFEVAERKAREALALDAREPHALIALARVQADRGNASEAQAAYLQALQLDPASASALRGLIAQRVEQGDLEGAQRFIAALAPAQRQALGGDLASMQARILREQADAAVKAGRTDQAVAHLTRAMQLDPADPWVRYDLAQLYARLGDAAHGRAVLDELLQARPVESEALHATALFLSGQREDMAALATLERIPEAQRTAGMKRLQRRVWTRVQLQRASALAKSGRAAAAGEILLQAETGVGTDLDLGTSVALAWAELGEAQRARSLLARLSADNRTSAAWRLRYAGVLAESGADAEAARLLDAVAASPHLGETDRRALLDQRESLALRKAQALRSAGERQAALDTLDAALASDPDRVRLLDAQASLLRALNRPREALARYRRMLALAPGDDDAYLDLVDTLIEAGDVRGARRMIDERLWVRTGRQAGDPDTQVKLAGILIDLGEHELARRNLELVIRAAPDQPRALAYLSDLARRKGRTKAALAYLQQSLAAQARARPEPAAQLSRLVRVPPLQTSTGPAQWSSDKLARLSIDPAPPEAIAAETTGGSAYRRVAELLDRSSTWVSGALDWRTRSGNGGTAELDAKEAPVELRMPWREEGWLFMRADFVTLSSGTLELADVGAARNYGTVLLCQPACAVGSVSPSETGASLTAGYATQNLRLDLGTTPLGFPVQDVVGGLLYKGDLGRFSYSVDASRRAVTSTLLSYAGARDPNTGTVWGGVRATGVRLGLSADQGGALGAWGSAGYHVLTGENVQTNNRMQLMAGGYWRVVNQEDRLLSVGLTGMYWQFKENAGEYTFGHGGYYSPQTYQSGTLWVSFGERGSRFAYLLRASASISDSSFDPAPFYPTDAALQARAQALSSSNGVDPHYTAGGGHGDGYSLGGSFEYQLSPSLFTGARLVIERSPYYAPNRLLLYFRYALDRVAARPVPLPPDPVLPTSEY